MVHFFCLTRGEEGTKSIRFCILLRDMFNRADLYDIACKYR